SDVPADHALEHVLALVLDQVTVDRDLILEAEVELGGRERDGLAEVPQELRLGQEERPALGLDREEARALAERALDEDVLGARALAEKTPLEEAAEHEVGRAERERLLPRGADLDVDARQRAVIADDRGRG